MTTVERPQCRSTIINGTRRYRCNRFATKGDPDGYCGHCRHAVTPVAEYTCRACWRIIRRGVDSDFCAGHGDRPLDTRRRQSA